MMPAADGYSRDRIITRLPDAALIAELAALRKRLLEKDVLLESKEAQLVSLAERCAGQAKRLIFFEKKIESGFCCPKCTGHSKPYYIACPWCGRKKSMEEISPRVEIGERREVS